MMKSLTIRKALMMRSIGFSVSAGMTANNCGIGSDGFQRGNTCAKGGGGSSPGVASPALKESVNLYSRHYTNGRKIAVESKAILTGGEPPDYGFDKEAKEIVDAVRSSAEKGVSLYRGLAFIEKNETLESLKPGQRVVLDRISSFSESTFYADGYMDSAEGAHKYQFHLEGGAKTLPTDHLTGMEHQEHLTFGEFEVTKISNRSADGVLLIGIKQTGML